MAYSEILNEIQEQVDELTASIASHQETIVTSTAEVERLHLQIEGLTTLKANAQGLIDSQDKVDINLNVSVTTDSNSEASVIRHSGATQV